MMDIGLGAIRVLIVEDEAESRAHLRGMLEDLGIDQVYEAEDGKKAMAFIVGVSDIVDLILCDWSMPNLSGIDFLRQLRTKGIKTPFVMLTGRSDQSSVMEVRDLGVAGYIRKPFSIQQMEARIRIMLQRMKAA